MKSYANLWPGIRLFENLYDAFRRVRRAKRSRPDIAAFEYDLEGNLRAPQRDLLEGTYRPGGYRLFFAMRILPGDLLWGSICHQVERGASRFIPYHPIYARHKRAFGSASS